MSATWRRALPPTTERILHPKLGRFGGPFLWAIIAVVSDLEHWLAAQARGLGLDVLNLESADPETLRRFCQQVLGELVARGMLPGPEQIGCYVAARERAN